MAVGLQPLGLIGWMAPDGIGVPKLGWVVDSTNRREPSMKEVTTIELDLAKNVFQMHGADAAGAVVVRRSLVLEFFAKLPCCLIGMEACATAPYWARQIGKLSHDVADPAGLCQSLCATEQERRRPTPRRSARR
jgi:hypothetical protein